MYKLRKCLSNIDTTSHIVRSLLANGLRARGTPAAFGELWLLVQPLKCCVHDA
jgi:hypothetical protein